MSPEYKIERARSKTAIAQANRELVMAILRNPAIELIGGMAAIAYFNKGTGSLFEKFSGLDPVAGAQTAALVALIMAQQLVPAVPAIMTTTTDVTKAIAPAIEKLAPLLLAAGVGA